MKTLLLFVIPFFLMVRALPAQSSYRIIAQIAEKHLWRGAKEAVHNLLGNESMADAASWADSALSGREYKKTASWHFLYVPAGLMNEGEFKFVVKAQRKTNLYTAILRQEEILKDTSNTKSQRIAAFKLLISLVADAQQPTHIVSTTARREKMHTALWDGVLIDEKAKSDMELATVIDKATPERMKQFQIEDPLQWLWESYEINKKLYTAVNNNARAEDFDKEYKSIYNNRLELAGLRLAAVLRRLFPDNGPVSHMIIDTVEFKAAPYHDETDIKDVAGSINKFSRITARVYGHKRTGDSVLVYLGAKRPDQLLTVVLKRVSTQLAKHIDGKTIMVAGMVIDYKGKPEIEINNPDFLQILNIEHE